MGCSVPSPRCGFVRKKELAEHINPLVLSLWSVVRAITPKSSTYIVGGLSIFMMLSEADNTWKSLAGAFRISNGIRRLWKLMHTLHAAMWGVSKLCGIGPRAYRKADVSVVAGLASIVEIVYLPNTTSMTI